MGRPHKRLLSRQRLGAALIVVALGLSTTPLVAATPTPAVTPAGHVSVSRPIPAPLLVTITAAGFVPANLTPVAGQTVQFDNLTAGIVTVRADTGAFDSGAVPAGGSYSLVVSAPGRFPFTSPESGHTGSLDAGQLDLAGIGTDLAQGHLPTIPIPTDATFDDHPTLTIHASRTRAMVLISPTATIDQVNSALDASGVTIVGTLPSIGVLMVAVKDQGVGHFEGIDAAVDALRAASGITAVALSTPGATSTIPKPPEPALATRPIGTWLWHQTTTAAGAPAGDGGNWGLEASHFPAAWNLKDQVVAKDAAVQTAVLDQGFAAHPDLAGTPVQLCTSGPTPVCNGNGPTDHGTHVAGTIGAVWNNTSATPGHSLGISGANPVANLQLIPWLNMDANALMMGALDEKKPGGKLPNLRVLNFSGTNNPLTTDPNGSTSWGRVWANKLCGAGAEDDAAQNVACTPTNEDKMLRQTIAAGELSRNVAERAAANDVLLVVATGNDSDAICQPSGASLGVSQPPCPAGTGFVPIDSRKLHPFGWADANWKSAGPNPIIMVEAVDIDNNRAQFSNIGGDVSAPGVGILSLAPTSADPSGYQTLNGTSMAAPHVAALAGYLLAYKPDLTGEEVKQLILGHTRDDTTGGARARIDAYSSILAIPGAAKDVVDVNDPSADGNRRVVRAADGGRSDDNLSGPPHAGKATFSAPDGQIDLRDFRRFRDAWLQVCQTGKGPDADCPAPANVSLDGSPRHAKKDLNLDGCVYDADPALGCNQTIEQGLSRFDFNGDGKISLSEFPVPLTSGGIPTLVGDSWTPSDLAMLQKYFDPDPTKTEGWTSDQLRGLLTSADVEVHADAFFKAGATSVAVDVEDDHTGTWVPGPVRTIDETVTDHSLVATQPVGLTGGQVRVRAEATIGNKVVRSAPVTLPMKPGGDARVDVCIPTVQVKPDDASLFTSADAVRIRLGLSLCPATDAAGTAQAPPPGPQKINLSLTTTPAGAAKASQDRKVMTRGVHRTSGTDATLSSNTVTTDAAGDAVVELAPGTNPEDVVIEATADLTDPATPEPVVAVGQANLDIADPPRLIYRYEQLTTDWRYQSSYVRDIGTPDETTVDTSESAGSLPYRTERDGSLTPTANGGAHLSEAIHGDDLIANVSTTGGAGGSTSGATRTFIYPSQSTKTNVDVSQYNVVIDSILPNGFPRTDLNWFGGVKTDVSADRKLASFWQLEDLDGVSYPYATQDAALPVDPAGKCSGSCSDPQKDQLQFIEREIRSGFRYSGLVPDGVGTPGDLTRVLNFTRNDAGAWSTPYTYCTPARTYPLRGIDGGDFFGTGTGTATSSFRFVAAVAKSPTDKAEDLALPDCNAKPAPPTALFNPSDRHPEEGRVVDFKDQSTGSITGWSWAFGDGSTSTEQNPSHTFEDNGSYDVTLTVTDSSGLTDTETVTIDAKNAPPEISADDVTVPTQDDPVAVEVRLTDPGHRDGEALQLSASWSSADPGLPTPITSTVAAGATQSFDLGTLPFGTYQLDLTATDKDGGTATTTVTISVGQAGTVEPDDTVDTEPAPACDFGISLGIPEDDTIRLLNTYRAASNLAPVYASPTLTKAAQAHAQWMVDNGVFSHIGANGSTPKDRANAAAYLPEAAVGENLALTGPKALDAIYGWRNSPTHNANMLRSIWHAVGVARIVTPTGTYWVHVFGDTADCPATPPGEAAIHPAASASGLPEVSRFHAWGPGGAEGDPLDAPIQTGVPMFRPGEKPFIEPDPPPISFPPPPSGTPPTDVTFTGLVVSAATPSTGAPITVTNRSTRNGSQVTAILAVADGRPPSTLPAGGASTFTVVTPGPLPITLTGDQGSALARTLNVGGTPVVASVSYQGETTGAEHATATLRAKVTAASVGVAGRAVTFTLGSLTASATTGIDGIAEAKVRLTIAAGPYTVKVAVAATTRDPAATATSGFTVTAHTPPGANAGGPYTSLVGDPLALDASGSTASSPGGLLGAWDLNGDGVFDDATGLSPVLAWPAVQTAMCKGTCSRGVAYPVSVQVTDALGSISTAASTVTLTSTYAISADPPSATLNPGGASSFTVSVVSQSGWDTPVHLSVLGLPAGVTAAFSSNDVLPNAAVTLTLSAAADVTASSADFVIHADSGGVSRETGRSITLDFGLVPTCYGSVSGVVLDSESGAPVPGASVAGGAATTQADGTFAITRYGLGSGNQPVAFYPYAYAAHYFFSGYGAPLTVGCGNPVTATIRMAPQHSSILSGTVVEGIPDPFDRSPNRAVVPSSTPIPNAAIAARSGAPNGSVFAGSADDGTFGPLALPLVEGNLPTSYDVQVQGNGYWQVNSALTASADSTQQRSFALVKVCSGTIDVRVVDETTHKPLVGATVTTSTELGQPQATTDANGRARLDPVALGYNNSSIIRYVNANKYVNGNLVSAQRTVSLSTCGSAAVLDIPLRTPIERRGSVTGRVVDEETGLPLAGITVGVGGVLSPATTTTGADGTYTFANLLLGFDDKTTAAVSISATDGRQGPGDHYEPAVPVGATLTADQTLAAGDLTMLRIRRGSIVGTVIDAVTRQPIPGASVFGAGQTVTDPAGGFVLPNVPLGPRNAPRDVFISASRQDYWSANGNATVTANGPATTQLVLIRACAPASVRGRVINAATGLPLEGAGVKWGPNSGDVVFTAADGTYEVPAIVVPQNRPFETTLLAYKDGFESQTRSATIQCAGRLTVDFAGARITTASVAGTVTDKATGKPLAGASVVGEWGGSAVTATDGTYRIANVPLSDTGTSRSWEVSVQPPALSPLAGQRKTISVAPNTETKADFALVAPVNHAPVAQSKVLMAKPGAFGFTSLDATDADGDPLVWIAVGTTPNWISFGNSNQAITFTAPTDGTREATVQFVVSDGKSDSNVATVTIQISAADPVAAIAPVAAVPEGSTITLDGSGSTPSTGETITAYSWDLDGNGTYGDATGPTPSLLLPNDPGPTVGLKVTDSAGLTATTTRAITVQNVVPVVDAGADITVGADGVFSRTVSFTDPGADAWAASTDWDGNGSGPNDSASPAGHSFSINHTFPGPGQYPVSVQVCDGSGQCGLAQFTVTVPGATNQPPVAVIAPAGPIDEGASLTFDGSGSTDAEGPIASYSWDLDGNGTYGDATGAHPTRSFPHHGTFTVGLRVTDGDGATGQVTRTVVVADVAPTVDLGADDAIEAGQPFSRTAAVTDPGDGPLSATLDYGDGLGPQPATVVGRSINWTHTFTTAGVKTVTAKVCDDTAACGTDTMLINVASPPPPDPVADLAITKSHTGTLVSGSTVAYAIGVTNLGPDSTSGTVTVTDPLPAGLVNPVVTAPAWTCGVAAGTVTCTRTGAIGVGAAPPITVTATITASAGATLANSATVASAHDPSEANNSATDTAPVLAPTKPEAGLAVSVTGPTTATAGLPVTWTVGVANAGPATSGLITVQLTPPAGATGVGATGPGWTCTGLVCTHAAIAPPTAAGRGHAGVAISPISVIGTVSATGPATFTAEVAGTVDDPDLSDNTASLVTNFQAATTTTTTTTLPGSTTTTSTTSTTSSPPPTSGSTTSLLPSGPGTSAPLPASAPTAPGGPTSTSLASTGVRFVGTVPWAMLSVVLGLVLVTLSRRRRSGPSGS